MFKRILPQPWCRSHLLVSLTPLRVVGSVFQPFVSLFLCFFLLLFFSACSCSSSFLLSFFASVDGTAFAANCFLRPSPSKEHPEACCCPTCCAALFQPFSPTCPRWFFCRLRGTVFFVSSVALFYSHTDTVKQRPQREERSTCAFARAAPRLRPHPSPQTQLLLLPPPPPVPLSLALSECVCVCVCVFVVRPTTTATPAT